MSGAHASALRTDALRHPWHESQADFDRLKKAVGGTTTNSMNLDCAAQRHERVWAVPAANLREGEGSTSPPTQMFGERRPPRAPTT